jgi:hypothetical protein
MALDQLAEVLTDDERLDAAASFVQHVAHQNNDSVMLFDVTRERFVYRLARDISCREQRWADVPLSQWRARAAYWREVVRAQSRTLAVQ